MERVLGVPELVSFIMDSTSDKKALYAAALTSKLFLESALDSLWREIRHLMCLFRLLGPMSNEDGGDSSDSEGHMGGAVRLPSDFVFESLTNSLFI